MDAEDRKEAECVLRALLLGAKIVGAHWLTALVLVISRHMSAPQWTRYGVTYDEMYLTLESRWTIFAAPPEHFPACAEDLPELSLSERVAAIAGLAQEHITAVALHEHHPHLILTFESGRIFFLNGCHEEFESWTVQTRGAHHGDEWTIVATPGSRIAVFDPKNTIRFD